MPTPKQMEKMAAAAGRDTPPAPELAPDQDLPPDYWQALLEDPRADRSSPGPAPPGRLRLSQMPQHLLRVGCRRCGRTVAGSRQGVAEIPRDDDDPRLAGERSEGPR